MWLPKHITAEVDRRAKIYYLDRARCRRWNQQRQPGEIRLFCGWCWESKTGNSIGQGFKTPSVAYREAYYALVKVEQSPAIRKPRLRVVKAA